MPHNSPAIDRLSLAGLSWFERTGLISALLILAWSPFSGGPRAFVLILSLMGGWLLWKQHTTTLQGRVVRRLGVLFLALWLPMLSSLPGSINLRESLQYVAITPLYFLAGIALLRVLDRADKRNWLTLWLAVVLAFWAFDGLVQYLLGYDLLGIRISADKRVTGIFDDNLRLATFLALLAPLLINESFRWRGGWLALILFLLLAVVVTLSGYRSAMLMAAIAGMTILISLQFRHKWKIVPVILLASVLVAATSPLVQAKFEQTRQYMDWSFGQLDILLSKRLSLWETGSQMFLQNPLTGVGSGNFEEAYPAYALRETDHWLHHKVYHAHQAYLSIAAENGVPGVLGLLAVWGFCLKWYFNASQRAREAAWPYAAGLVAAMFPINSQPILYTHWFFPILLLLMALMLNALNESTAAAETPDEGAEFTPPSTPGRQPPSCSA